MSVSEKTKNTIWGKFAGKCAICKINVTYKSTKNNYSSFGEVAHIIGEKKNSARHNSHISLEKRNHHDNLMLLCANHHTIIDKVENINEYTVKKLHEIKTTHLTWIEKQLELSDPFTANIYHLFYINIPRLSELALRNNEKLDLSYYQRNIALHKQKFEFLYVMNSTQKTLEKLFLRSLKLNSINFPSLDYHGYLIYFDILDLEQKIFLKKIMKLILPTMVL